MRLRVTVAEFDSECGGSRLTDPSQQDDQSIKSLFFKNKQNDTSAERVSNPLSSLVSYHEFL